MKKIMCCVAVLLSLSLALAGCSKQQNMDVLKELTLNYKIPPDFAVPEESDTFDSSVNKLLNTDNGFIAKILPVEYIFYYTIDKDEDTGEIYMDGYAECRCSIQKISQKFNVSNYSAEEIYIRENVFLEPVNEEALKKMLESIGAYKNDTCIEGTYKIPNKFINATDYRLLAESQFMWLEDKPYYSLIRFDDDVAYLSYCYMESDGLEDNRDDMPNDIITSSDNFRKFLETNDPDLLGKED